MEGGHGLTRRFLLGAASHARKRALKRGETARVGGSVPRRWQAQGQCANRAHESVLRVTIVM